MPKISGWEVLEERQRDSALQAIPLIVMSTFPAEKHAAKALATGARHYIEKPNRLRRTRAAGSNALRAAGHTGIVELEATPAVPHRPHVLRDACFHCRSHAERLVNAAEIVNDKVRTSNSPISLRKHWSGAGSAVSFPPFEPDTEQQALDRVTKISTHL
jgi:CheY-like chemotaxis protein